MINWIIGGIIVGFTVYVIAKKIISTSKGEDSCGCCSSKNDCHCK